ncbi:MAG: hypothetical protein FK733_10340 [Asgard group archaeon]|nr:hypothetical protein [Asgard group archaeon]
MSIPLADDSRWKEVVVGSFQFDIEFFPLKLLLARQRLQLQMSEDPETVMKCVEELRQLFDKNLNHPIARKDLVKIFGRRKLRRLRKRR